MPKEPLGPSDWATFVQASGPSCSDIRVSAFCSRRVNEMVNESGELRRSNKNLGPETCLPAQTEINLGIYRRGVTYESVMHDYHKIGACSVSLDRCISLTSKLLGGVEIVGA